MATKYPLGYDPDKDYSAAMMGLNPDSVEYKQLETERNNKINDVYGGVEPTLQGSDKTYTQTYGTSLGTTPGATGGAGNTSNDNTDWYGSFLEGIQTGADYDTLLDYYNNRVAKTAPGGGYEQYANDDAQDFMLQYLTQMQTLNQPTYNYGGSEWDNMYEELMKAALGYNYDAFVGSDQYSSLADRYSNAGNRAMRDTIGQVGARTGGLASSYATTAAQQQYNEYMTLLEDVARQQFESERGNMIENAQLAGTMSERDYQRYLDELSAQQQGQSASLDAIYQLLGYQQDMDNIAYDRQQDAYKQNQTERAEAQARIYDFLVNQGGSISDLPAELITASGYTTAELNSMANQYATAMAQANAKKYSGSSGGSGSSSDTNNSYDFMDHPDYKTISKRAAQYDTPEEASEYLARMIDSGFPKEAAAYIFEVELGYDALLAGDEQGNALRVYSPNTSYLEERLLKENGYLVR